jgi:orotate phosphoribosyltransferase-like protein
MLIFLSHTLPKSRFLRKISDNDQKAIGEIFGLKNIKNTETKDYKRKYALLYGGHLGSILLKESCQNIVKHGLGKSPFYYGVIGLTAYQKIMHKPHFSRCADWQTEYFDAFDESVSFMRFVIGDNGSGIQTTLENNYRKRDGKQQTQECTRNYEYMKAILEWSFEKHSSSDRSGEHSSSDSQENRPTTGLYRIQELVKEYNGLLSVCSGGVRRIKNFASEQKNDHDEKICEEFKGTLIDAVFPLIPNKKISKPNYMPRIEFGSTEVDLNETVYSDNVAEPSKLEIVYVNPRFNDDSFEQPLAAKHAESVNGHLPLVIDLCDSDFWADSSNKGKLEELLHALSEMNQSNPAECYLLGVTNSYVWPAIRETNAHKNRNSLILGIDIAASGDNKGEIHCRYIGAATLDEEGFLETIAYSNQNQAVPLQCRALASDKANKPWFSYDESVYEVRASGLSNYARITQVAVQGFRHSLLSQLRIINQSNRTEGWVCLDGRYYVSEYMPVEALITDRQWEKWVEKLLLYTLFARGDGRIEDGLFVGTTIYSKRILDFLQTKGFATREFESTDHLIQKSLTNDDNQNVYVVLELVGTGDVAKKVIDAITKKGSVVSGVLTIVDTRDDSSGLISGVPVYSLVQNRTKKISINSEIEDESLIKQSTREGAILAIDTSSGKYNKTEVFVVSRANSGSDLSTSRIVAKGVEESTIKSACYYQSESEFWNEVQLSEALEATHGVKTVSDTYILHHLYYINPAKLILGTSNDCKTQAERVKDVFETVLDRISREMKNRPEVIIYPEHAETSELFACGFEKLLTNVDIIRYEDIRQTNEYNYKLKNKNILVFDTGTNQGRTLSEIAAELTRANPKKIDFFVVLNRLSDSDIAKKLSAAGERRTFIYMYQMASGITYDMLTCPFCKLVETYKGRRKDLKSAATYNLAEALISKYSQDNHFDVPLGSKPEMIRLFGLLNKGTIEEIVEELNVCKAAAIDLGLRIAEFCETVWALSYSDEALKRRLAESEQLKEGIKALLQCNDKSIDNFLVSKVLANIYPDDFIDLIPWFIDVIIGRLELGQETTNYYQIIVDGIADIKKEYHHKLRNKTKPEIERLKRGYPTLGKLLEKDFDALVSPPERVEEWKQRWNDFNGEFGFSHSEPAETVYDLMRYIEDKLSMNSNNYTDTQFLKPLEFILADGNEAHCNAMCSAAVESGEEMLSSNRTANRQSDGGIAEQIRLLTYADSELNPKKIYGSLKLFQKTQSFHISENLEVLKELRVELSNLAKALFDKEGEGGIAASIMNNRYASIKDILKTIDSNESYVNLDIPNDVAFRSIVPKEKLKIHLNNIARNSQQYNPNKKELHLDVKFEIKDEDYALISFQDNGIGATNDGLRGGLLSAILDKDNDVGIRAKKLDSLHGFDENGKEIGLRIGVFLDIVPDHNETELGNDG